MEAPLNQPINSTAARSGELGAVNWGICWSKVASTQAQARVSSKVSLYAPFDSSRRTSPVVTFDESGGS
jgi:hypothetical protein